MSSLPNRLTTDDILGDQGPVLFVIEGDHSHTLDQARLLGLVLLQDHQQLPFLQQGHDGIAPSNVLGADCRLLTIKCSEFFVVYYDISAPFVEQVDRLVEGLGFGLGDAYAGQGLFDLEEPTIIDTVDLDFYTESPEEIRALIFFHPQFHPFPFSSA